MTGTCVVPFSAFCIQKLQSLARLLPIPHIPVSTCLLKLAFYNFSCHSNYSRCMVNSSLVGCNHCDK